MGKKSRIILLSTYVFLFTFLLILNILIPEQIYWIRDKKNYFEFNLPLSASIHSEKQGVLKINNQEIKDENIKINLKKPFSVEPSELTSFDVNLKLFDLLPVKKMKVEVMADKQLVPCGNIVGVRIFTDGIMVLGTGYVAGVDGKTYEPSKGILKTGDSIEKVNNIEVKNKEDLINKIEENEKEKIKFQIKRNKKQMTVEVKPVKNIEDNEYKIGIWVRDSTQGIGTITYYDPQNGMYGALGHGIVDVDTDELMKVKKGNIMKTQITYVKKGERGTPGELMGVILDDSQTNLGDVQKNTEYGIFGTVEKSKLSSLGTKSYPIALKNEVKNGQAYIYSDIMGNGVEKFEIEIENVNRFNYDISKGIILKIKDKRLLEYTHGIIQGMSGSPIIQNDRLVGAVTHVFVQDPSKGYGIFIENMLNNEKK